MILSSQYFLKYWVAYQTGPEDERTKKLILTQFAELCLQGYGPCWDHRDRILGLALTGLHPHVRTERHYLSLRQRGCAA